MDELLTALGLALGFEFIKIIRGELVLSAVTASTMNQVPGGDKNQIISGSD